MRTIVFVCWLALPVGALLYGLDGANAQAIGAEQACTPDAMRLCSAFIPDRARVAACMRARRAQLSAECRRFMVAGGHVRYGRHVRGHVRHYRHYHRR